MSETVCCFYSIPNQEKRFVRPEAPAPKTTPRTVGQVAGNPPSSTQPSSSSSSRPQPAPTSTPAAASATASTPAPATATLPNPVQVRLLFWLPSFQPSDVNYCAWRDPGCGLIGFGFHLLPFSLSNTLSLFLCSVPPKAKSLRLPSEREDYEI